MGWLNIIENLFLYKHLKIFLYFTNTCHEANQAKMCLPANKKSQGSSTSKSSALKMLPEDYTPAANDILCGRGNVFSQHQGNRFFDMVIRDSLRKYMEAPNRPDKIRVVDSILRGIRVSGARFAKCDSETQRWYELNDVQAHQKIGHAIRDTIRLHKKQQQQSGNSSSNKTSDASSSSKSKNTVAASMRKEIINNQSQNNYNNMQRVPLAAQKIRQARIADRMLQQQALQPPPRNIFSSSGSVSARNDMMKAKRSAFLLENEFPELNFDFSPSRFFDSIIVQ